MNTGGSLRLLLLLAALLAPGFAFSPAIARAQAPLALSISQLDTSGLPEVTAIAVVTDAEGQPVGGLDASAFAAAVGGQPAQVLEVAPQVDKERGLGVVVAIDRSESMEGEPLDQAKQAGKLFIGELLAEGRSTGDRAALLSFAASVTDEVPFTDDTLELNRSIDRLVPEFRTVLYDAVAASVRRAAEAETPAKAVVLLSDGEDFGSVNATRDGSIAEAGQLRIPIFVLGIGYRVDEAYLREVAEASGGQYLFAPSAQQITEVFAQINELLRSQYRVRLRLPEGAAPAGRLELSVTVDGASATDSAALPAPGPSTEEGADQGEQGGAGIMPWAGIAVAMVVIAGGALYWHWGRRRAPTPIAGNDPTIGVVADHAPGPAPAPPQGRLTVVNGPQQGAVLEVRDQPITLGSHPDCSLRLRESDGEVAARHARIWLRQGRFMIHHLASTAVTRVGGRETDWAVLESGDYITIGPHELLFEVREGGP